MYHEQKCKVQKKDFIWTYSSRRKWINPSWWAASSRHGSQSRKMKSTSTRRKQITSRHSFKCSKPTFRDALAPARPSLLKLSKAAPPRDHIFQYQSWWEMFPIQTNTLPMDILFPEPLFIKNWSINVHMNYFVFKLASDWESQHLHLFPTSALLKLLNPSVIQHQRYWDPALHSVAASGTSHHFTVWSLDLDFNLGFQIAFQWHWFRIIWEWFLWV